MAIGRDQAQRSEQALHKASHQRSDDGQIIHSFKSLITELALRARNVTRIGKTSSTFTRVTKPTPLQEQALRLVANFPVHV
ncbi:MAG: hypothetical protein ACLPYS_18270 [Vulcanimicrobiaceae bacterium]